MSEILELNFFIITSSSHLLLCDKIKEKWRIIWTKVPLLKFKVLQKLNGRDLFMTYSRIFKKFTNFYEIFKKWSSMPWVSVFQLIFKNKFIWLVLSSLITFYSLIFPQNKTKFVDILIAHHSLLPQQVWVSERK